MESGVVAQLLATIRQHEEKEAQLQVKVEQLTGALTTLSEEHRRTIETERTAHQQTVETLKTERDDLQRSNAALTNALAELKEPDPSSVPSSITEDMSVVRNANEALAKEVADLKAFMQDIAWWFQNWTFSKKFPKAKQKEFAKQKEKQIGITKCWKSRKHRARSVSGAFRVRA